MPQELRPPARPRRKSTRPPPEKIIAALMAAAVFVIALLVGCGYEYINGVYVRGPCALLCVIALTVAMLYPASAWDEARARGEDENDSFRT